MGLGQPRNCGSIPGRGKRFLLFSNGDGARSTCHRLGAGDGSLGRGVKWPGHAADHMTRLRISKVTSVLLHMSLW